MEHAGSSESRSGSTGDGGIKSNMRDFVKNLFDRFLGMPFDVYTIMKMENEIKEEIYRKCPDIERYVRVEGKEIHFDERFLKNNNGIICFLPCIFAIKEKFFYDVYAGTVPVGEMAFEKNLEPDNYGYIITTRSLFKGEKDILQELLQIKQTTIAQL